MRKILGITLLLLCVPMAWASNDRIVTAVFSHTYNGYQRPRSADGTFEREYYALANGKYLPGVAADASIDKVKFPQIAGVTAQFLALRNYFLAPDAKQARFLLVITWGTTIPLDDGVYRNSLDSFGIAFNQLIRAQASLGGMSISETRGGDGIVSAKGALLQAAKDDFEAQTVQFNMFNDMRRKAD